MPFYKEAPKPPVRFKYEVREPRILLDEDNDVNFEPAKKTRGRKRRIKGKPPKKYPKTK